MLKFHTMAAAAVALTAVATASYAATENANDATAVNNAKVSLTDAVHAAEQHVHGRASSAEYENTGEGQAWDVEVVNGSKVFDVEVDAQNGSVLRSTADKADKAGREEGEDGEETD